MRFSGFRPRFLSAITIVGLVLGFATAAAPAASARALEHVRRQQEGLKVWVNTSSGVYHCPGTRYYGTTKAGTYLTEDAARQKGYRPAYGKTCGPVAGAAVSGSKRPLATAVPDAGGALKVWVNTASGVYHCPRTRYYGNTKTGKYMTEVAARAAGNRPAYGQPCT
jgi:hypothetical protein